MKTTAAQAYAAAIRDTADAKAIARRYPGRRTLLRLQMALVHELDRYDDARQEIR